MFINTTVFNLSANLQWHVFVSFLWESPALSEISCLMFLYLKRQKYSKLLKQIYFPFIFKKCKHLLKHPRLEVMGSWFSIVSGEILLCNQWHDCAGVMFMLWTCFSLLAASWCWATNRHGSWTLWVHTQYKGPQLWTLWGFLQWPAMETSNWQADKCMQK